MTADALAPLAVAVPLLDAGLCATIGRWVPPKLLGTMGVIGAAVVTAICGLLAAATANGTHVAHWFGGWQPVHGVALGIAFVVEPVGALLATFAALLTFAAFIFATTFYDRAEPAFAILMKLFLAALVGFCLTGDLFNLFVFFELMSVAAYGLTGYRTEDASAVEGALSFGVVNSTGAFFTLIGIALIYGRVGALDMGQIARSLAGVPDPLVTVGAVFVLIGFLVKASIVPFHFWLADAHAVAPTPLCVLFSGIMVQLGLYAVARVYYSAFGGSIGGSGEALRGVLLGFGVTTALLGGVMSFGQRHLKRLLAFSTIGHSGIMLCAFALFSPLGLAGMWVYLVGHGFVKAALFMMSGIALNLFHSLDLEVLRARMRDRLWLPAGLAVGGLGLAGVPPFGTMLGKSMLDDAARDAGVPWLPPVLLIAAALTGGAVLAAAGRFAFGWGPPPSSPGESPAEEEGEEPNPGFPTVMFSTAVVLLAAGLASGASVRIGETMLRFSADFMARAAHGHVPPLADGTPAAIVSGALALAFAAGTLFGHRLPPLARGASALTDRPFAVLHALHSGKVTDYLAWLTAGSAALGAGVAAVVLHSR